MKHMKKQLAAAFVCICMVLCTALPVLAHQLLDLEDGTYAIEVELQGGSGKAYVDSPAKLTVVDGQGYATLKWSSSNYDYMIVDGEKYLPINDGGNSTFEIPILVYNKKQMVIADTTAMGTPHEVEYALKFSSSGIMGANETPQARARYSVYIALIIIAICVFVSQMQKYYKVKMAKKIAAKRGAHGRS